MIPPNVAHKTDISQYEIGLNKEHSKLKEKMIGLGYGDVSLEDFAKQNTQESDSNLDDEQLSLLIETQDRVKQLLKDKEEFAKEKLNDKEILEEVKQNPTTETISRACRRINKLRSDGMPIESDQLLKRLRDTTKEGGVSADTINQLLKKEAPAKSNAIALPDLPFTPLGFNSESKAMLWHRGRLMHFPVSTMANTITMLWGLGSDQVAATTNIIQEKGLIDEETPLKTGIWQLPEWKKEGKVLIISGRGAVFFEKGEFTELEGPVVDGQLVHFERKAWVNIEDLKNAEGDLKKTFNELKSIIEQWSWKNPSAADWMTAFVMIMPFQQLMSWRPWLWIDGPTGCGKSAFFEELLEELYGQLTKRGDKATGHSMFQSFGNTAKIPLIDEFEKYKHNNDVLNMAKLMNRGGEKTSGTPGENELCFKMHHMPIFGSIHYPRSMITDHSQRNRLIRFSLQEITVQKKDKPQEDMEDLGCQSVKAMITNWERIECRAKEIQNRTNNIVQKHQGKIEPRTVHNFMYAAAIIGMVNDTDVSVPEWAEESKGNDGLSLIQAILYSKVRVHGEEYLVQALLEICIAKKLDKDVETNLNESTASRILVENGIKLATPNGKGLHVAFLAELISKHLLSKDSDFKDVDPSTVLERLPGAERRRTCWIGTSRKYPIQVPISVVLPKDGESEDEEG